jgi:hypothetical protein
MKCTSKQITIRLEWVVTSFQANPHFRTYNRMCNWRLWCCPSKWFQTLLVGLATKLVLLVSSSTRVCFGVLNVAERFMHFHIRCTKMFSKFPFKACNRYNTCYVGHLVPHSSLQAFSGMCPSLSCIPMNHTVHSAEKWDEWFKD